MRILSIANVTPWPARGGIHLRMLNLLERMAAHHDVTLGCHVWTDADRDGVEELNRRGLRTIGAPVAYGSVRRHALGALRRAVRGIPPETAQYESPVLHGLVGAGAYDLLHIEESTLAPYARSRPAAARTPQVLTLHNVHFVQDRRVALIEKTFARRTWKRFNAGWMRSYEPRIATAFDRVIAVSEEDRDALRRLAPSARIEVVPNGVDTKALVPLAPHAGPPALLFVGSMHYRPCADAAEWFVRAVLPLVRAACPDVTLWIVGRQPTAEVRALAGAGVHVTGEVDDVRPFYARASVAVVPLRAGGGSRLKILEAMALGRAVVSTTIGAEGLRVEAGRHLLIADTAASLAAEIGTLLHGGPRRDALTSAARLLVEGRYDWDAVAERQLAIFNELVPSRSPTASAPSAAGPAGVSMTGR